MKEKDINYMPDQKLHRIVSFIKSTIRIFGYVCLIPNIKLAIILLLLSEVIGIAEELV